MEIEACELFRVTRNANTERDEEEADDLLELIESELRERRFAPVVRLEVERGMDPRIAAMLAAELGLDEHDDVFEIGDGMLALRDLMELAALDDPGAARSAASTGRHAAPADRRATSSTCIRDAGSILLMHPYESFADLGRALPARGQPGSQGARDQDDAVPHLARSRGDRVSRATPRATASRSPWWSSSRRASTRPRTSSSPSSWRRRHPRHLRRGRPQDALQDDAGRAPGLRRPAPLRAHRHRQLSRRTPRACTPTSGC